MLIRLTQVDFHIGSTALLDQASLTLDAGERVAILGRNGAGKSTLLRPLEGGIEPEDGEVLRQPGLRVARLDQEVPRVAPTSRVRDVVRLGLGAAAAALQAYEAASVNDAHKVEQLGRLQAEVERLGAWDVEDRVAQTLAHFSLDGDADFSKLSGGLKRRVLLAQAWVRSPQLLLLDEPTNHLDIEAIRWLETFLKNYDGGLLFVTHDRTFLRNLATRIIELDRGAVTSWPGDYQNFLRRRQERDHAEAQDKARFGKLLAQEEVWIRQGIQARRTRNEGRVRRLMQLREQAQAQRAQPGHAKLQIAEAQRSGKLVCEAQGLSYAIGGKTLVRNFDLTLLRGEKLGLIGANGVGKTTLIRLLLGELSPDAGELRLGTQLQVAYFDQLRAALDEDQPVFEVLGEGKDYLDVGGARKHVMGYLQDFLFTPDRARSPVRMLSGGERNRLLLARLFARASNLLVLDEPTNDLDLETLELLEERLLDYAGTVLLVSHDRAFLDQVVTRSLVFEGDGKISEVIGGYSDWLAQRGEPVSTPKVEPKARPASVLRPPSGLSTKARRELERLPQKIEKLEAQQARLGEELAAQYLGDAAAAEKTQRKMDELTQQLDAAYRRWEELEGQDQSL